MSVQKASISRAEVSLSNGQAAAAESTSLARAERLRALRRVTQDDMLGAFGLRGSRAQRLTGWACLVPAHRFADQVLRYDDVVAADGLRVGGAWAVDQFTAGIEVVGQQHIPRRGPVLVLSNHPGLTDTVALFASIPRDDLLVIAGDRPFLRLLLATSRHLLYVGDDVRSRLVAARSAARHLRAGGAVLTFPGGTIEPDPAVMPGARAALSEWKPVIEAFGRLSGEVTVVPAIVSGVISAKARAHPLTRMRRKKLDREWLGAMLQVMWEPYRRLRPRVEFGEPICVEAGQDPPAALLANQVITSAGRMVELATKMG